ncbi:hypothetical protein ANS017_26530 [Paraclostridium bifermentans]|uniref:hypothetical protein n=1 Tax=Paraclostridium bifermentans TaxID=1490 RepID=UPI0021C498FF|nr:hypothetical protein [Paraclostridium bifermentans]GKZ04082.1 hypothetical protein ANS014_25160 [Paraclostridium bifermentans]GKZ05543.1 hypothetical protein ANS015_04260 [Paraclostridium bifermentans]GKZ11269.1 hypothetical protein ANS017_26530 [Paraclostridium bifermentans]
MDGNMLRGNPTHLTLFYSKRTGDIKKFTTGITDLIKAFGNDEGEELSLVYDTLIIDFDENIIQNYNEYKIVNGEVVSKKTTVEQIEKQQADLMFMLINGGVI